MREPMRWTAKALKGWSADTPSSDGRWIPARPLSLGRLAPVLRIRLAWRVLIGRYDALDWEDAA